MPILTNQQSTAVIIVNGSNGFASIKGRSILLVGFPSIFPRSRIFFVLNSKYSGSFGIITILFKNSKSNLELMFEEIKALAMIDNGRTDHRASFLA